jgi:hypothetical protein
LFYLSSDSSDDEKNAYIQLNPQTTMSMLATVDPTSTKVPMLTEGDISPSVMMDFENTALDFFVSKSVPAEKQVPMIIPGIKDLHICDWITAERARIVGLPFANFMSEMHLNYLPPDWEDQVHNEVLTSMLSVLTIFLELVTEAIEAQLSTLWHSSAFNNVGLCNHLEAHLDNELKAKLRHNNACKDKNLKIWVTAIRLLDKVHAVETKHQRELIEETILQCQAKRQNTNNDGLWAPLHHGNTNTSPAASSASSSSYVHLPSLTDTKHMLLNEHEGCTKCCQFYVGHHSQSCPNGFPVGKGYKTLTTTDTLSAKKAKAIAKPSVKPVATKAVAATSAVVESVSSSDEISAAATIPPDSNGQYNSDSDEDWDVLCHVVSMPIHGKHLIWHRQVHSLTEDFPVRTHTLINNGMHLVLICPELVEQLSLKNIDYANQHLLMSLSACKKRKPNCITM